MHDSSTTRYRQILHLVADWIYILALLLILIGGILEILPRGHRTVINLWNSLGWWILIGFSWSNTKGKTRTAMALLTPFCMAVPPVATVLKLFPTLHLEAPNTTSLINALGHSAVMAVALLVGRWLGPYGPSVRNGDNGNA